MGSDSTAILVLINIIVTVGGGVAFLLRNERRITKLETSVELFLKHILNRTRENDT